MANEPELIAELSGAEWMSIEAISKDIDLPVVEIAHLYKIERASIQDGAKIKTYIPVIASRNVRIKLKQHHKSH